MDVDRRSLLAISLATGTLADPRATPVGSIAPATSMTSITALGVNAVYLPFRVPRDTLPDFLRAFEQLPVERSPIAGECDEPFQERLGTVEYGRLAIQGCHAAPAGQDQGDTSRDIPLVFGDKSPGGLGETRGNQAQLISHRPCGSDE